MKPWQFDVAFIVVLALLVFLAVAPVLGLNAKIDPLVVSAVTTLATFLFTRKTSSRNGSGDGS